LPPGSGAALSYLIYLASFSSFTVKYSGNGAAIQGEYGCYTHYTCYTCYTCEVNEGNQEEPIWI